MNTFSATVCIQEFSFKKRKYFLLNVSSLKYSYLLLNEHLTACQENRVVSEPATLMYELVLQWLNIFPFPFHMENKFYVF